MRERMEREKRELQEFIGNMKAIQIEIDMILMTKIV